MAAARAFFERAVAETAVRPVRVTTDKAGCYPPALRMILPEGVHRTITYLSSGPERDQGYLKQPVRPMRRPKNPAAADTFCRGRV